MPIADNLNNTLRNYLLSALSLKHTGRSREEAEERREWLGSLLDSGHSPACKSILQFFSRYYSLSSMAWLERRADRLEAVFAIGERDTRPINLNISPIDQQLFDVAERENLFELTARQSEEKIGAPCKTTFSPDVVGSEISGALIVGDEPSVNKTKWHLGQFRPITASELEILRLREDLNQRDYVECAVKKFNESVKDIDNDGFWSSLVNVCAELMQAERSSLLVFDEKSNSLSVEAATGIHTDTIKKESFSTIIAEKVLQTGESLIVEDIRKTDIPAASADRNYKSNSFISHPIIIGQRKISVLNLTDRTGGEKFSALDLKILKAITLQLAILLDLAILKRKAGELEQISVTDELTGLLNRSYLNERLPEEISRSHREGYKMSFVMIDVDNFKSYNDNFGHAEGDKALQLVAQCLKDVLRGEDVAVRFGGEEFSILLPQTTLDKAAMIAERLREKVAAIEFHDRQMTISIGVADCSDTPCTAQEVIKWADDALYEAKRRGKNNVQIYAKGEIISHAPEKWSKCRKPNTVGFPVHSSNLSMPERMPLSNYIELIGEESDNDGI